VTVKEPAPSQYLSLAATLEFVKGQIKARSILEDRVWRPIYRALYEGMLVAIGDFEDRDGRVLYTDQEVLPNDWRALEESDFREACARPRVLQFRNTEQRQGGPYFLTNVRIELRQVRAWLGLDATADGAKPPTAFAERHLERDMKGYITGVRTSGQQPTQREAEDALGEKFSRDAIRAEFKRQIEAEGGEVKAGRPKNAPPKNPRQ
jgi:hypothetical protein